MKRHCSWFVVALSLLVLAGCGKSETESEQESSSGTSLTADIKKAELGQTHNVHTCDDLYLAGQFTQADIATIKDNGIERVITLRMDGEVKWDEKGEIEKAGMEFVEVPFRAPDSLTDDVFDEIRELLRQDSNTLLHCGGAVRVGAVWMPYRVLDQGVDIDQAIEEARKIGNTNAAYEKKAIDYIKRKQGSNK